LRFLDGFRQLLLLAERNGLALLEVCHLLVCFLNRLFGFLQSAIYSTESFGDSVQLSSTIL